jgi:hypothetical protein
MPRPLRLSGISLTKHGKKRKIVIQLPIEKGLIGITTRNNKQYLLIGKDGYYVERVIVFNPINETIETDFTSDILDFWNDKIPLSFSDNGSFILANGTYWKYNTASRTYQIISLGISTVYYTKWLSDRFIVFWVGGGISHANVYDLDGNLISTTTFDFYLGTLEDLGDKVGSWLFGDNKIYIIDINTFEVNTFTLPFGNYSYLVNPFKRIKNTNKLHVYDGIGNKLYALDMDTQQLTLVKDFSGEDFISGGFQGATFDNNGKILFMAYWDVLDQQIVELWSYNVETNELRRIPLSQYPFLILEDNDSGIFTVVDVPAFYSPFIYDYNEDKVIGTISNFGRNPLYSDGKILLTVD